MAALSTCWFSARFPPFIHRESAADRTIAEEFKGVVNTAIAVLIVSGVVLSLSRLTSDAVSLPYIAVLAGKVTLAAYMFYIIWSMQDGDDFRVSRLMCKRRKVSGLPGAPIIGGPRQSLCAAW